jgi:acetyl esterase/lipase
LENEKDLFYLYCEAFVSGDYRGSVSFSTKLAQETGRDLFLPSYRLCPEHKFLDE